MRTALMPIKGAPSGNTGVRFHTPASLPLVLYCALPSSCRTDFGIWFACAAIAVPEASRI